MKKLYEIFGQRLAKGDVGIEIEVEGKNLPYEVDPRWKAVEDGSLRGESREYVLDKPIPVYEALDALTALRNNLADAKAKLEFSFRTSVHVHINVQELTYPQYLNLLYVYFLLEEPLMTFCGKERKGNRFCLRLQDAEGMLETYNHMFSGGEDMLGMIPPNQMRYSAMNIEATPKYGSLEFRGMRGNMDLEVLDVWVRAIHCLREFAKSVSNPTEVYSLYAELEAQGFLDHVLGDLAPRFYYPRVTRDIQRSFSLSIDLPFAHGRYLDRLKEVEEPPVRKAKPIAPRELRMEDVIAPRARLVMPAQAFEGAFGAPQIIRDEF